METLRQSFLSLWNTIIIRPLLITYFDTLVFHASWYKSVIKHLKLTMSLSMFDSARIPQWPTLPVICPFGRWEVGGCGQGTCPGNPRVISCCNPQTPNDGFIRGLLDSSTFRAEFRIIQIINVYEKTQASFTMNEATIWPKTSKVKRSKLSQIIKPLPMAIKSNLKGNQINFLKANKKLNQYAWIQQFYTFWFS